MPALFQTARGSGFWKLLACKNQNNIPVCILQRHSVRKRILPDNPPDVDSQRFVDPGAGCVKIFMTQGGNHPQKLSLRLNPRYAADQAYYSWHNFLAARTHVKYHDGATQL